MFMLLMLIQNHFYGLTSWAKEEIYNKMLPDNKLNFVDVPALLYGRLADGNLVDFK